MALKQSWETLMPGRHPGAIPAALPGSKTTVDRRENGRDICRKTTGAVRIVADLNGDSRPDIVASAEHGSYELRWWRNEGRVAK